MYLQILIVFKKDRVWLFFYLLFNSLQDEEQRDQQSKVNFLSYQIIISFYNKLMSWFFFCVSCRLQVVLHLHLIHDVDILYLYDWCRFHFLYLTILWRIYLCTFDGYTCVHDVIYLCISEIISTSWWILILVCSCTFDVWINIVF